MSHPSLVIVGGAPRSGTTLVQRVLNSHPEIYGGPEFDLLPDIVALHERFRTKIAQGRISSWLDQPECDRAFQSFIRELFRARAEKERVRIVSEKTPDNLLVFGQLHEILPEAKFLFVVRDPRAIVSSMLQIGRRMRASGTARTQPWLFNALGSALYVRDLWRGVEELVAANSPRVRLAFYEEFVRDPEKAAGELCQFLGIAFSEQMTKIEDSEFDAPNEESFRHIYRKEDLSTAIHRQSLEKWAGKLTRFEEYCVRAVLGPEQFPWLDGYYTQVLKAPPHYRLGILMLATLHPVLAVCLRAGRGVRILGETFLRARWRPA